MKTDRLHKPGYKDLGSHKKSSQACSLQGPTGSEILQCNDLRKGSMTFQPSMVVRKKRGDLLKLSAVVKKVTFSLPQKLKRRLYIISIPIVGKNDTNGHVLSWILEIPSPP